MEQQTQISRPTNPRWLFVALTFVGIHQVQSLIVEPEERPFRAIALAVLGFVTLSTRLPERARGILWMVLGLPAIGGAFAGHLIPIVREHRVPSASETAPLNLAGGAFLLTLGAALTFRRSS